MAYEEEFEQAARRSYKSEMEDLHKWARKHGYEEEDEDEEEENDPEPDDVDSDKWDAWYERQQQREAEEEDDDDDEYMEALSVDAKVELTITLGTGGPACGYILTIDEDGEVTSGCYWYKDWFKEKRRFSLSNNELDLVCSAYGIDPSYYRIQRG